MCSIPIPPRYLKSNTSFPSPLSAYHEGSAPDQHVWKPHNHREVLQGAQRWQEISLNIHHPVSLTFDINYLLHWQHEQQCWYFKSNWYMIQLESRQIQCCIHKFAYILKSFLIATFNVLLLIFNFKFHTLTK